MDKEMREMDKKKKRIKDVDKKKLIFHNITTGKAKPIVLF
jgi:hypothetical protein